MLESNCSMEEVKKRLAAPFSQEDIEWRVSRTYKNNNQQKAWVVPYVQSRAIMSRLDDVLGIDGWEDEYKTIHSGIICGIRIWFSDNKSRIKWDGADLTNVEATKGGLSSALKRAAVQWGIGRYLYQLSQVCVDVNPSRGQGPQNYTNDKKTQVKGYWSNPTLPAWALPNGEGKPPRNNNQQGNNSQRSSQRGNANGKSNDNPPNNQSKSQQGTAQRGNNQSNVKGQSGKQQDRDKLLAYIDRFEKQIGLHKCPNKIVRIFNKANDSNIQNIQYIKEKATVEQISRYYLAIKPVNDVCLIANNYNCKNEILDFVQIIKPEHEIESYNSLFFILNADDVKRITDLAKQDFENKQNQSA